MKIGNRIRILGALGAATTLVLVVIVGYSIGLAKAKVDVVTENVVPTYQSLLLMQQSFLSARVNALMHVIEQNPAEYPAISANVSQYLDRLNESLTGYEATLFDKKDKEILDSIRKNLAAWRGNLEDVFAASNSGNKAEASRLLKERCAPLAAKILNDILEMSSHYSRITQNSKQAISDGFTDLDRIMIGTAIVLVILLLSMGEFITRSITRPLNSLRDIVTKTAESYDFTLRTSATGDDEVSQIQKSFNHLLETICGSLQKVRDIGQAVGRRAGDVAIASSELSSASNRVSESSEKMAAGTEQVTVSVMHVADRSHEADECAREAGDHAKSGGMVIENTITRINLISDYVHDSSEQIESLVKRTESIGIVVNTIKEIADQTNLLALNAAIEAARAGETGRGFAVVADEVRKLAERTSGSTQEISTMVGAIQAEAAQTVAAMKNTVTEVEQGVTYAQEALGAIAQIRESTEKVKTQVGDISTAMREQSVASGSMAQEIEKVAQMAEETSVTAQHAAESSTELNTLAVNLNRVIDSYTI